MALNVSTLERLYGFGAGGSVRGVQTPAADPNTPVLGRQPGGPKQLIQKPGDPAVYSYDPASKSYTWIPDEATAATQFGPDWASHITQAPDLSQYGTLAGSGPPAPNDPYAGQDPEFQQYLASVGIKDDTLRANAEGARNDAEIKRAFYMPEIDYQGGIARRNIDTDSEARGVFRSGEHERNLAEQLHGQQQQVAALNLDTQSQVGQIERGLSTDLVNSQVDQYQARLAAAQRQYLKQGIAGYQ